MWYYYALGTALLWGVQNVVIKKLLKKTHTTEYLTIMYMTSFALLLPFISQLKVLDTVSIITIIIRSIFMVVAMLTMARALKHLPISTAMPMTNIMPLFSLILGFILLNEIIGVYQIIGVFVIIIGSYVLDTEGNLKNWKKPLEHLLKSKYMHFIIIYAFYRALAAIISKVVLKQVDTYNFLFYHTFFTMMMFLGLTFFIYDGIKDIKEGFKLSGYWILVIGILGVSGSYLSYIAFADPLSLVSLVVPILGLRTLVATVLGGKLFHEKHITSRAIASLLMIFGVTLLVL